MHLSITNDTTVSMLQQAFHHNFPYLKIEVFHTFHQPHELNSDKQSLPSLSVLSMLPSFITQGEYEFSPLISTTEFEQGVATYFGIPIQVMRKSGGIWLQTSQTDDWSLEKQNEEGRIASTTTGSDEVGDYTLRDIE